MKLFKMNFDKKLNKLLTSMVEIAFEYAKWDKKEVEFVYVYGTLEESISYNFFFKVNGQIVKKHKLNDYSKLQEFDISVNLQKQVLSIGKSDLEELEKHFKGDGRDIPTQLKMIYDTRSGKFDSEIKYDNFLLGSDKNSNDIVDEWIKELSNSNIS